MDAILTADIKVRGAATTETTRDVRVDKTYTGSVSGLTKPLVQDIALTASETDHAVDFGEVTTAAVVYIRSDKALSVKLNGAAAAVPLGKVIVLFDDAGITSISLTNTEAEAASVTVVLAE